MMFATKVSCLLECFCFTECFCTLMCITRITTIRIYLPHKIKSRLIRQILTNTCKSLLFNGTFLESLLLSSLSIPIASSLLDDDVCVVDGTVSPCGAFITFPNDARNESVGCKSGVDRVESCEIYQSISFFNQIGQKLP
jgi:hypothetical protein